jgi:hypothetical protein
MLVSGVEECRRGEAEIVVVHLPQHRQLATCRRAQRGVGARPSVHQQLRVRVGGEAIAIVEAGTDGQPFALRRLSKRPGRGVCLSVKSCENQHRSNIILYVLDY